MLGTISVFAYRHRETKKNLCLGGRSQDLPSTDFYPAVRHDNTVSELAPGAPITWFQYHNTVIGQLDFLENSNILIILFKAITRKCVHPWSLRLLHASLQYFSLKGLWNCGLWYASCYANSSNSWILYVRLEASIYGYKIINYKSLAHFSPSNTSDKYCGYQIFLVGVHAARGQTRMRQNFHAPVPTHFYELPHSEHVAVHIGMKLNRQLTSCISLVRVNIWIAARIGRS